MRSCRFSLSHPLLYSAEVNPSFLCVYMMFILLNSLSIGDVCLSLPLYLHVKYINSMFTTLSSQDTKSVYYHTVSFPYLFHRLF